MNNVAGWFVVDEAQCSRFRSMLPRLPEELAECWLFQSRTGKSPIEHSFIHFGACLSVDHEKVLLSFIYNASNEVYSEYDDPVEFIEGDFFVSDINRQQPELRLRVAYGNVAAEERTPYRPPDLQC